MPGDIALELRGITKRFGSLVANDAIDFELRRGEIHALLGENGAGKSTLMNVLYGLQHPDEGEIVLDGEPVRIDSARRAIHLGIGMVHQHFMLVPVMTVAENLVLGTEPHRGPLIDFKAAAARARELSERFGLAVDPDATADSTERSLARLMVGRDVLLRVEKPEHAPGETVLEVRDLHVADDRGLPAVRGLSLQVRAGEIVGLAGVDANGQSELTEAIMGLRTPEAGQVIV